MDSGATTSALYFELRQTQVDNDKLFNCLFSICNWYLNRKLSKWTSAGPDLGSNDGLTTGTRRILTVSN